MGPSPSPKGRGQLAFLGKILFSGVLLAVLFWRVDREVFIRTLQVLPAHTYLGALGLYALSHFLSIIRWQLLLAAEGIQVPLWRLAVLYLQGAFFNLFLPSLIGGDIFRGYAIHRTTQGHDAAIASVLLDRLTGFAALIAIALTAQGLAFQRVQDARLLLITLAVTGVFVLVTVGLLHDRAKRLAQGIFRIPNLARFQSKLQGLIEALHRYRSHHRAIGQALLLSAVLQALVILAYYVVGSGLSLGVPILDFFLFVPVITFVAMLPVSVAGLGVREGSTVYFFTGLGVDAAAALSMSLAWFSLSVLVSALGGLIFAVSTHTAKRQQS